MKFANKQIEQLPLANLTIPQFLTLAIKTSNLLGWVLGGVNTMGFIAYTNNGLFSWNAEVRLRINNGIATLQSESRGDDVKDVRENRKNLRNFMCTFNDLKKSLVHEEFVPQYEKLRSDFSLN